MNSRKVHLIVWSLVILLFLSSSSSLAASYYVDATNGNDLNNGLSPDKAWKTIKKVSKALFNPGDEIKFKRGEVFNDSFLYLKAPYSGKEGKPITFKDYGAPNDSLPTLTFSGNTTIWMIDKTFVTFNNLELVGGNNQVVEIKQSAKGEAHHLIFKGCIIRNSRTGIWVDTATGGMVEGCTIHNCGIGFSSNDPGFTIRECRIHDNDVGIKLGAYNTVVEKNEIYNNKVGIKCHPASRHDVIFRYNAIRNNTSHGFETRHSAGDVGDIYYNIFSNNGEEGILLQGDVSGKIYNNLIYSNGLHGIHLAEDRGKLPSMVILKNNIIMDNGGVEVKITTGAGGFTSDYNCIYHSAGSAFMHWSGTKYRWEDWKKHSHQDAHSINKAPSFLNKAKENFRLTRNSPCIDTGENVGLKGTDYHGNPIPYGQFDIGVHEVQDTPRPTTPTSGLR